MDAGEVPGSVWRAAGVAVEEVAGVATRPLRGGTGAASHWVDLVTAHHRDGGSVSVVRKTFRPLSSGRHAVASRAPDHWAYWRRELLAYPSGLLPRGPALRAPRLLGTVGDVLYLEYVGEIRPSPEQAAHDLGRWHQQDRGRAEPWLARHQLAQRLAVTDLDWSTVDVDSRLPEIWDRRHELLAALGSVPSGIAHGDFSTGNLRTDGTTTVALDWATLGVSPVGTDLAHLALASLTDSLVPSYRQGLQGRYRADDIDLGYRTTLVLVGTSRVHWMASRSIAPPPGYVDFVCQHVR